MLDHDYIFCFFFPWVVVEVCISILRVHMLICLIKSPPQVCLKINEPQTLTPIPYLPAPFPIFPLLEQ